MVFINNKYYYFENAWMPYKGVEEFNSLSDLLKELVLRFNKMCIEKYHLKEENTVIYEYDVPKFNICGKDFFAHCEKGVKINI